MSESFDPNSMDSVLSKILTSQQNMAESMKTNHTEVIEKLDKHDTRIRRLEGEGMKQKGILAGIGVAGGSVGHLITKWFSGGGPPPSHH